MLPFEVLIWAASESVCEQFKMNSEHQRRCAGDLGYLKAQISESLSVSTMDGPDADTPYEAAYDKFSLCLA